MRFIPVGENEGMTRKENECPEKNSHSTKIGNPKEENQKSDWMKNTFAKINTQVQIHLENHATLLILFPNLLSSTESSENSTHHISSKALFLQILDSSYGSTSRRTHLVLQLGYS